MAAKTYRVRIARDGYDFEAEGDKAFVMQMLKRFVSDTGADTARLEVTRQGKPTKTEKSSGADLLQPNRKAVSIREFIQRLPFKKHTDITIAFAYFLEKHSGLEAFTPADINNCYYEAKMESSNTSQMIIQNIKRGYLMPGKQKGDQKKSLYTLTSTGETFIKSKLKADS